jgi:hypothetical protein
MSEERGKREELDDERYVNEKRKKRARGEVRKRKRKIK